MLGRSANSQLPLSTEPGQAQAETITLDKWHVLRQNPVVKTFSVALIAASLFFVPVVTVQAETVTVDKWYKQASEPVRPKDNRAYLSQSFAIDPVALTAKESVLLDKWFQATQQPVIKKAIPLFTGDTRTEITQPITLDKWHQPASQPVRPRQPLTQGSFNLIPSIAGESVLLDKWFVPISQPVDRAKKPIHVGETRTELNITAAETITADKWYQLPNQPLILAKNIVYTYPSFSIDANLLTKSENVLLDKWFQPSQQPLIIPRKPVFSGDLRTELTLVTSETVTLDKWFQPSQQPLIIPRKPVFSGDLRTELTLVTSETVTLDKWFQPLSIPVSRIITLNQGSFNLTPQTSFVEVVLLDKWLQPTQQPVYRKVVSPFSGDTRTEISIAAPEIITLDKWQQQINIPVMLAKNWTWLYPNYFVDPTALMAPPVTIVDVFPGAGHPGKVGYYVKKRKKITKYPIDRMLDAVIQEVYQELTGPIAKSEEPVLRKEVAQIVKPYAKTKNEVPNENKIDWISLQKDVSRVDALLKLWQEQIDIAVTEENAREEEIIIQHVMEHEKMMASNIHDLVKRIIKII